MTNSTAPNGNPGPGDLDLTEELALQVAWHWDAQLRPRLEGLTDQEYLWEPVPGSWNVRPRDAALPRQPGSGPFTVDWAFPEPDPAPVTTIAWRLAHLIVGVIGERNARYFAGPPIDYDSYAYDGTADGALAALDAGYARWIDGMRSLSAADLADHCREPGFESDSMMAFILHIHREVIHHGAEIALLRDLYRAGHYVCAPPLRSVAG